MLDGRNALRHRKIRTDRCRDVSSVHGRDLDLIVGPEPVGFGEDLGGPGGIQQFYAVKDDDDHHARVP